MGILVGAAISASQMGAWSHLLMAAVTRTLNPDPNHTHNPNPNPYPYPLPYPRRRAPSSTSRCARSCLTLTLTLALPLPLTLTAPNPNPNPHLCEVMPRELHSTRAARGAQLAALLAGFAMMAVLKIWV